MFHWTTVDTLPAEVWQTKWATHFWTREKKIILRLNRILKRLCKWKILAFSFKHVIWRGPKTFRSENNGWLDQEIWNFRLLSGYELVENKMFLRHGSSGDWGGFSWSAAWVEWSTIKRKILSILVTGYILKIAKINSQQEKPICFNRKN